METNSYTIKLGLPLALLLVGCGSDAGMTAGEESVGEISAPASVQYAADMGAGLSASYRLFAGFATCADIGCIGFAPPAAIRPPKRTHGSNSQVVLPNHTLFGDVNGDRQADIIQYDDNGRVFAHRGDYRNVEIHHFFMPDPIERMIIGDFYGAGWDQACVVTRLGLNCYGIDATQDDQFRLFFKQPNPITATEDVIVGDYNADGKDDLFLYDRVAGTFRMLIFQAGSGFVVQPNWVRSNLSRVAAPNISFRAGDWNGDGRDDLVASNSAGQVMAFAAATTQSGLDTFFWAFDSVSGFIPAGTSYALARMDDDAKDDLVIHDPATGNVAAYQVTYNNGRPPALDIHWGQLPVTPGSTLVMQWSHPMRNELGVENRDDPFLFTNSGTWLRAFEARWDVDRSRYTYWVEYQSPAPNNQTGWPATVVKKTLVLKCKVKDDASENADAIIAPTMQRIRDYFWETTYKHIYLSNAQDTPIGWVQLALTYAEVRALGIAEGVKARHILGRECARAAGKDPASYDSVITFMGGTTADWGASDRYATFSGQNNGELFDVWVTVQEITHTLGISSHTGNNDPTDSEPDTGYGNPWDPMSARTTGFKYTNPLGRPEGPEFTAGIRDLLGSFPARRVYTVPLGAAKRTIVLSALNRPATTGYLQIHLDSVATPDATSGYFSLEYREPTGFDAKIPHATVLVHRVRPNSKQVRLEMDNPDGTYVKWDSAERLAGESYTIAGVATIRVVSINQAQHYAEVEISPI
jgi:hypothetical protein